MTISSRCDVDFIEPFILPDVDLRSSSDVDFVEGSALESDAYTSMGMTSPQITSVSSSPVDKDSNYNYCWSANGEISKDEHKLTVKSNPSLPPMRKKKVDASDASEEKEREKERARARARRSRKRKTERMEHLETINEALEAENKELRWKLTNAAGTLKSYHSAPQELQSRQYSISNITTAINHGRFQSVTRCFHPNCVMYNPGPEWEIYGFGAISDYYTSLKECFSNFKLTDDEIQPIDFTGDKFRHRWTISGVIVQPPPSASIQERYLYNHAKGKEIRFSGTSLYTFDKGQIIHCYRTWNPVAVIFYIMRLGTDPPTRQLS